jgi:hypothetical protein
VRSRPARSSRIPWIHCHWHVDPCRVVQQPARAGDLWKSFDKVDAFAGIPCLSSTAFSGCDKSKVAGFQGQLSLGFVRIRNTFAPAASPVRVVAPTKAPVRVVEPTPTSSVTCSYEERLFSLTLDVPGGQASAGLMWMVDDVANANVRVFSPVYDAATTAPVQYKHDYCLPKDACYKFALQENDSLQGTSFYGTLGGNMVVQGNSRDAGVGVNVGDFGAMCNKIDYSRARDTYAFGKSGAASSFGMMFDIQAKEDQHVNVYRFAALHLESGSHDINIFTKNGSYKGYEHDASAWTQVLSLDGLGGQGGSTYTWQSDNLEPKVGVLAETTQAFYILDAKSRSIYYNNDLSYDSGDLWKSFDKLDAFVGTACDSSIAFKGCRSGLVAAFEGQLSVGYVPVRNTFAPTACPVAVRQPALIAFPKCSDEEDLFVLALDAPAKGSDLSWTIDEVGKTDTCTFSLAYVDAAEPLHYKHRYCLPKASCYKFVLCDSSGQGTSHYAAYNGEMVAGGSTSNPFSVSDGDFGSSCSTLLSAGRTSYRFDASGDTKANGIMFDIQAKGDQHVNVYRFAAFHLESGSHKVKIFTKNGSYKGYESNDSAWTQVTSLDMLGGKGHRKFTWQNANLDPNVAVLADTTQAFYIFVDSPSLYYNADPAISSGDLWKSFDKFDAFAGTACVSSTEFRGCRSNVVAGFEGYMAAGYVIN